MTPNEFKAWFDGFTEAFAGRIPTKAQWGRIKDRLAEIDGKPTTHTVYVDRYVRQYPYYPRPYLGDGTCGWIVGVASTSNIPQNAQGMAANNISNQIGSGGPAFNSLQAMTDLGRAEAAKLAS